MSGHASAKNKMELKYVFNIQKKIENFGYSFPKNWINSSMRFNLISPDFLKLVTKIYPRKVLKFP